MGDGWLRRPSLLFFHKEIKMKNGNSCWKMICAVLAFGMIVAVCESLDKCILSSAANANSINTDTGQVYYFYNESSYTVTIMDQTWNRTIQPGGNTQIRYNRQVSIYSVNYSPADSVVPSQSSGTHITFRDR